MGISLIKDKVDTGLEGAAREGRGGEGRGGEGVNGTSWEDCNSLNKRVFMYFAGEGAKIK